MGTMITFFNHKGGVGKTTLVHNLCFLLADRGYRVLAIDADPQMNLTAAMYGLSTSIEYSTEEGSKWNENMSRYISLPEYLNVELKGATSSKELFRTAKNEENNGFVELISGSINLADIESDLFGIIKNRNTFTESIPFKFESSIKKNKDSYDFILIDTSPSASSVVNALIMMSTDYFITPVSPSFFSLQAIDNLSSIFNNWIRLLGDYQTTQSFRGLSFQPKFLGLVVQMAKRFSGGSVQETTSFSSSTEKWVDDVNRSVKRFHRFAMQRGMAISEQEFNHFFGYDTTPFVIQKCCDFTPQLRSIAEKASLPVVKLTQKICNEYKDSNKKVDITKEDGQYTRSIVSITSSYNKIVDGLIKLEEST
jgi:cellulose biosynthesis protein BcsQ